MRSFILSVFVLTLFGCLSVNKSHTDVFVINNKFPFALHSYRIFDSVEKQFFDFRVSIDSNISPIKGNSKLIKINFKNDSIFEIKTYILKSKRYTIFGNMGEFKISRIQNTTDFEIFLLSCYKKSWRN